MEEFPVVDIGNRGMWFDIFYLLAFLLAFLLLLYQGRKKAYPQLPWLLMVASGWLLFVLGCKLLTYSADEWREAYVTYTLPVTSGMTILGGLLLGMLGMLAGRWWGRLPWASLDIFAWVIPLCVAVQHTGCFIIGCCHGKVTDLAWAVRYPANTVPHYHQLDAGMITYTDAVSLPVHPTQLYEVLAALVVFLLVVLLRKLFRAPGSTYLCFILFFSSFRFLTEFFKAKALPIAGSELVLGINMVQWGLLLFAFIISTVLLYRERRGRRQSIVRAPVYDDSQLIYHLLYLLLLVVIFWTLRDWLALREIIVLNIVFLPLIAAVAINVFKTLTVPAYRWLTVSVLVLPLFLMSQTLPTQHPDSAYLKTYKTIGIGLGTGNYQNFVNIGHGDGCDRISNTQYFKQQYTLVGGGWSMTREREKEAVTYGINIYGGKHIETRLSTNKKSSIGLFGINPYIKYDQRFVGIGGGLHIGNLVYTLEDQVKEGNGIAETGLLRTPVYPQFFIRAGPRDILFAQFQLADNFPSLPGLRYQFSLGSGFGLRNGTALRVGTNTVNPFIAAYVPIQDQIVFESLYLFGESNPQDQYKQRQFSLGLHYRFDHKETGSKVGKSKKKRKSKSIKVGENPAP